MWLQAFALGEEDAFGMLWSSVAHYAQAHFGSISSPVFAGALALGTVGEARGEPRLLVSSVASGDLRLLLGPALGCAGLCLCGLGGYLEAVLLVAT